MIMNDKRQYIFTSLFQNINFKHLFEQFDLETEPISGVGYETKHTCTLYMIFCMLVFICTNSKFIVKTLDNGKKDDWRGEKGLLCAFTNRAKVKVIT